MLFVATSNVCVCLCVSSLSIRGRCRGMDSCLADLTRLSCLFYLLSICLSFCLSISAYHRGDKE
ncbi:hypothetical protein DFA_02633 [Cavenderia fasciculata]|uniref:Transmembrane protein n=1 Tax=Cavenderia fasciculata TaxID=261658 RepID=F4PZY0_CACFS|nr:uncharacterized protein DFA_02633 [Cavenderia fasciculata]EGG18894.1 hypothetical protein DFA_02633 [Cavenderia fasciculata]|eukprot:XP_004357356.1 hypothetical protein DFA_02633 [Cavenderia fasciculata]